ncbi:Hsp70 family protein [Bdellovibrio bacteriovorus]|uniref:Molecular chaperone, Hsp70 family n=1 Tax=Bdellovibrio bacteriovorus (strain ATCC 15356 / DSM 50701 / NCIMB 9529 / HD100) TaxID=264462 RepID=Q6MI83_BDEBA|nr:Hsp70 family protein [Bdellovibrio bacteriovorus]AHZ83659.1 HSP70 family molecular chaperone [Bdellovibrio bacteriovorus]BEV69630.1 Chaperone protein DnaK [Bdellovibrio bacteriovorus]CAE78097.1 molecular chaperone, Hsp70 family [Bdellovibrio bacteriovorus HD100]
MSTDTFLSIDFGTSNSLVGAYHQGKRYEALTLDEKASDPTMMRTLLYFPNPDLCYYGAEAIEQYIQQDMEGRLFRSFKSHLPNQNYLGTVLDNRILTLETLIGVFLLELKKRAEKSLDTEVTKAVIGRPARYSMDSVADGFALHRMQKAAAFAGFKEVQFVPEPLAAAFDYRRQLTSEKIVLIGDFGGGTSDFTLIKLRPSGFSKDDVLAIDGCPLAGDALDSVFMSHKLNEYFGAKSRYRLPMGSNVMTMPKGVTLRLNHPAHIVHLKEKDTYEFIREVKKCSLTAKDAEAVERLFVLIEDQQIFPFFENIERTKRALSNSNETDFEFDYPGLEISEHFTSPQFVEWAKDTRENIFASLDQCLKDGNVTADQVDLVCLTGGTAKVPFIQKEFEKRFGLERLQTQSHFHSVLSGLTEAAGFVAQGTQIL